MRTLWKGAISFGLVNIPVKMYSAVEDRDIHFKQLHSKCTAPIRYEKQCSVCGKEVPPDEIVMGYEYETGRYIVMRDEDLARIPEESSRTIDIMDFVSLSEIDPIFYDKTYYLEPNAGGEKAYALLRRAMSETGKIAIAKVVIRSKSALACLRIQGQVVIMETMFYPDEIRSPAGLTGVNAEPRLSDGEIRMAVDLVGNLGAAFDASKYTDDYREQLMGLIQAKIAGAEFAVPVATPQGGKVVDLMEALRASLAATASVGAAPKANDPDSLARKPGVRRSPLGTTIAGPEEAKPKRRKATTG